MRKKLLYIILLIGSLGLISWSITANMEIEHPIQIIHKGIHPTEPIECTLIEIQNEEQHPIAFYMDVESVVCGDSQCRVDIVRIYWDNLGQFDRLAIPNGVALEKAKGEHFNQADYKKLDKILNDKNSPLKEVYKNEIVSTGGSEGIDGMSGATVLVEKSAFVEGAVWSCYSLWHWVHGETQQLIRGITGEAFTNLALQDLLKKDSLDWQYFAVEQFTKRKDYTQKTVALLESTIGQNPILLKNSLPYWELAPNSIYTKVLSRLIQTQERENRLLILNNLLKTQQTLTPAFFNDLSLPIANLTYPELTKFLTLLEKHTINSNKINTQLIQLLKQDNFLIARRTYWFLSEQPLSKKQAIILKEFLLKYEDRL